VSEAPITHGSGRARDRRYRLCKCNGCGIERLCTPTTDFYTKGDDKTGPLYCEACVAYGGKL
jgi:hypothetical protein